VTWVIHPTAVGVYSQSITNFRKLINKMPQVLNYPKMLVDAGQIPAFNANDRATITVASKIWDTKLGNNNRGLQTLGTRKLYKVTKTAPTPAPTSNLKPTQVKTAVSTLKGASVANANIITVVSTLNFKVGEKVWIGTGLSDNSREIRTITAITSNAITLNSGLTSGHPLGALVEQFNQVTPTNKPGSCKLQIPATCKFPFVYKGITYSTCIGTDSLRTLWCSTDSVYAGHFAECTDPCKGGKWPAKKIASTVIAASVAATGLGLITAAMVNEAKKHNGNPFGIKPVGQQPATTPAPGAPVTYSAVVDLQHAEVGKPGLAELIISQNPLPTSVPPPAEAEAQAAAEAQAPAALQAAIAQTFPSPFPSPAPLIAAARLLSQTSNALANLLGQVGPAAPSAGAPSAGATVVKVPVEVDVPVKVVVSPITTTMGPEKATMRLWLLIGVVTLIVLALGFICSLGAAFAGGYGQRKGARTAPEEEEEEYIQA